jgi:hypothetical protein
MPEAPSYLKKIVLTLNPETRQWDVVFKVAEGQMPVAPPDLKFIYRALLTAHRIYLHKLRTEGRLSVTKS